jgi:hypothetical protein
MFAIKLLLAGSDSYFVLRAAWLVGRGAIWRRNLRGSANFGGQD